MIRVKKKIPMKGHHKYQQPPSACFCVWDMCTQACVTCLVCVCSAGGSGLKWVSCLCWNQSGSCCTVRREVLLHVVCMSLCGFNRRLYAVSGFCIWLCWRQKIFFPENEILRKWHKKASLLYAMLGWNLFFRCPKIQFQVVLHLLSHTFVCCWIHYRPWLWGDPRVSPRM